MALHQLGPILYGSHDCLLVYLKQQRLLARDATCITCGSPMQWKHRGNVQDNYTWRCRNSRCRKMLSIRHGSFFEKSKLSLKNWLHVIYLWAVDTPLKTTVEAIGISARTTVNLYNFLRDVCSWKLLQQPILLGGPGVIVQIDKSLFKHKPKVKKPHTYMHSHN